MRGASHEVRVVFSEEFGRQIRNMGFLVFTAIVTLLMVAAVPLTPLIADFVQDDVVEALEKHFDMDAPFGRIGYADPASVLPMGGPEGPRRYADAASGIRALQRGEIDSFYMLTPGYLESGVIEQYWTEPEGQGIFIGNAAAEGAFRSFLRARLVGEIDSRLVARALDTGNFASYRVAAEGALSRETPVAQKLGEFFVPVLFGVLLMVAVVTGGGTLLKTVAEEKETRMFEHLVTSASPMSIMTGKLLAIGLVGLLHMAAWVTAGAFAIPRAFNAIPNGGELTITADLLLLTIVSFMLGYFLFSVLSLFVGTIVSSAAEGQRQTGILAVLAGLPIWFTGVFISFPDIFIARALTYFPFTAPTMIMVRKGAGGTMPTSEVVAALALVFLTGLVFLWISARVFRAGILLSGQRFTPRTAFSALRHAD